MIGFVCLSICMYDDGRLCNLFAKIIVYFCSVIIIEDMILG